MTKALVVLPGALEPAQRREVLRHSFKLGGLQTDVIRSGTNAEPLNAGSRGPLRRSITVAMAVWVRLGDHNISVLSAAVAFYCFHSIFPAIAALVSLYGLVADTNDIVRQLNALQAILPEEATALISDRLKALVQTRVPLSASG